jgi:hypothetical protein
MIVTDPRYRPNARLKLLRSHILEHAASDVAGSDHDPRNERRHPRKQHEIDDEYGHGTLCVPKTSSV